MDNKPDAQKPDPKIIYLPFKFQLKCELCKGTGRQRIDYKGGAKESKPCLGCKGEGFTGVRLTLHESLEMYFNYKHVGFFKKLINLIRRK